jgi:predicted HTH transcriptional regulator
LSSDKSGESTLFIEFMPGILLESLEVLLKTQNVTLTSLDRVNLYHSIIKTDYFTRKDYLRNFRQISTATASRDLKLACEKGLIGKYGDKNAAKYKYSNPDLN